MNKPFFYGCCSQVPDGITSPAAFYRLLRLSDESTTTIYVPAHAVQFQAFRYTLFDPDSNTCFYVEESFSTVNAVPGGSTLLDSWVSLVNSDDITACCTHGNGGTCTYSLLVVMDWGNDADLDLYVKNMLADSSVAVTYFQQQPDVGNGLVLNHDAHPSCMPDPLSPEIVSGNFTGAGHFQVWYNQYEGCSEETAPTLKMIRITNTGSGVLIVNGDNVSAGSTWELDNFAYAGYSTGIVKTFNGGTDIVISCGASGPRTLSDVSVEGPDSGGAMVLHFTDSAGGLVDLGYYVSGGDPVLNFTNIVGYSSYSATMGANSISFNILADLPPSPGHIRYFTVRDPSTHTIHGVADPVTMPARYSLVMTHIDGGSVGSGAVFSPSLSDYYGTTAFSAVPDTDLGYYTQGTDGSDFVSFLTSLISANIGLNTVSATINVVGHYVLQLRGRDPDPMRLDGDHFYVIIPELAVDITNGPTPNDNNYTYVIGQSISLEACASNSALYPSTATNLLLAFHNEVGGEKVSAVLNGDYGQVISYTFQEGDEGTHLIKVYITDRDALNNLNNYVISATSVQSINITVVPIVQAPIITGITDGDTVLFGGPAKSPSFIKTDTSDYTVMHVNIVRNPTNICRIDLNADVVEPINITNYWTPGSPPFTVTAYNTLDFQTSSTTSMILYAAELSGGLHITLSGSGEANVNYGGPVYGGADLHIWYDVDPDADSSSEELFVDIGDGSGFVSAGYIGNINAAASGLLYTTPVGFNFLVFKVTIHGSTPDGINFGVDFQFAIYAE